MRSGRAKDGKTWMALAKKVAIERVVPWLKWMDGPSRAPGTLVGYELVDANIQEGGLVFQCF